MSNPRLCTAFDLDDIDRQKQESEKAGRGAWIQTFLGLAFFPLDPRCEDIFIKDIAHALSNQCRFTGHVKRFYSVAEHCWRVSGMCKPEDALWGLLHDASEAYVVDVPRPIKRMPGMEVYRAVEKNVMKFVAQRFGLPPDEPASVERADKIMLAIEARDLLGPLRPGWEAWDKFIAMAGDYEIKSVMPWTPAYAEKMFLDRFCELGGNIVNERLDVKG